MANDNKLLNIFVPNICLNEQAYTLGVLLNDFLGLKFDIHTKDKAFIEIRRNSSSIKSSKLTIDASFFHLAHKEWLKPGSMPKLPLASWAPENDGIKPNLIKPYLPILYGKAGLIKKECNIHLNLDVFGSAFFMLSRYEELITCNRDVHNRFPGYASIAFKAGFLERPIINEYLEILCECLKAIWPDLVFKKRSYKKVITCDVDHPFDLAGYSLNKTILRTGARLIRDKNFKLALYDLLNYLFKKFNSDIFDQYRKNIEWMIKVNNQQNNKVTFNFIPIQTDIDKEDTNDVRSKKISHLLRYIVNNGHEVGFHPGYNTFNDDDIFKNSAKAFKEACKSQQINLSKLGGRQHYLRYQINKTPQLWEENGFMYDSSLGYADMAGFRCGVCYEYGMYDLAKRKTMKLKQRPLIVMDCTIIEDKYEGLGFRNQSINRFKYFKDICQKYNGDFVFLWHNSYFSDKNSFKYYELCIK